ncbi:MAG: efflux RND transporter periplasmic adaptor subunit [Gammaproteobacteria bacterium]|nr:efflux RND transporter periplasmic adaptor subunit [Gammaproteobacteria bacterium]
MNSRLHTPALFLLFLTVAGCGGSTNTAQVEFRIPVEVDIVGTDDIEDRIITTGTLRTRESVILSVETPGFLILGHDDAGLRLVEGSSVTSGQLIAKVTGEDARLAARLDATKRHLESAKQEMERRQELFKRQLIAEENVWQARARYEDALHDFETSERVFERTHIVTPIAGIVLALARDENGRPVADGQKVNFGFEVARIAQIDSLIADIDLVGPELARVRPGQTVRIRHYAFENMTINGKILRLSPSMDPQTHTFRAEVEVDNSQRFLRPGMFVEAAIIAEQREDVAVVPRDSVTQRAGQSVVFVIDGQRAVRRAVSLGLSDDDQFEVIAGVLPGERVVVRGLETLTDGTRVRVISP